MIASKRHIQLRSNLVYLLQVTVGQTLLILMNIKIYVFTGVQKRIFTHYVLWGEFLKCSSVLTDHSLKLKLDKYFVSDNVAYCIDFGV